MKRILLLLTVCAALEMAGCCCHGHNDCIDDGCNTCQQGCNGSRHKHCNLFHHKHSRDCQADGQCQGDCQYPMADGYPVDGQYQVQNGNRCQADGNCKLKNRRSKKHKSCPHCGREYAGGMPGSISPCCGETLIGDCCGSECGGITQAGFCSGGCGDCCGGVQGIGGDCSTGNCGGGCATGNCNATGLPGASGGCATGNCGGSAPVAPAPRTGAMTHPYDELQALQAAGWSIVETPGSSGTTPMSSGSSISSGNSLEPVPAPPSVAPAVPVRPAGSH